MGKGLRQDAKAVGEYLENLAENYPNEALALGEALSSSGSATVNVSHPAVELTVNLE